MPRSSRPGKDLAFITDLNGCEPRISFPGKNPVFNYGLDGWPRTQNRGRSRNGVTVYRWTLYLERNKLDVAMLRWYREAISWINKRRRDLEGGREEEGLWLLKRWEREREVETWEIGCVGRIICALVCLFRHILYVTGLLETVHAKQRNE